MCVTIKWNKVQSQENATEPFVSIYIIVPKQHVEILVTVQKPYCILQSNILFKKINKYSEYGQIFKMKAKNRNKNAVFTNIYSTIDCCLLELCLILGERHSVLEITKQKTNNCNTVKYG